MGSLGLHSKAIHHGMDVHQVLVNIIFYVFWKHKKKKKRLEKDIRPESAPDKHKQPIQLMSQILFGAKLNFFWVTGILPRLGSSRIYNSICVQL